MDINKKHIIIFGTLILLLIIIVGGVTYYSEKKEQASILENFGKQKITIFSENYPQNYIELSDFIGFCKRAVFSGIEEFKNNDIKEVACMLVKTREDSPNVYAPPNSYTPIFTSLDSISSFKPDRYIGISVDIRDVLKEYDESLLEEEKLYFCSIIEPSLMDPLVLQLESPYDLFFDEGDVSCAATQIDEGSATISVGFVPQAESIDAKLYLVDEQTVSNVISKQSFLEMKEIIENYPILWHMEKSINL
jgi:hypothetical protein